jgi:hypothetical protein
MRFGVHDRLPGGKSTDRQRVCEAWLSSSPRTRTLERAKQRSARGRLPTIFLAVGFHRSCSTHTAMGPLDSGSRRTTQGWDCHRSRTGRRVRSLGALKVRVQRLLQRISRPSSLKTACGCWPEPFINDLVADHHAFPSPSRAYRLTTLHTFLTGPLAGDASCCGTSAQGWQQTVTSRRLTDKLLPLFCPAPVFNSRSV